MTNQDSPYTLILSDWCSITRWAAGHRVIEALKEYYGSAVARVQAALSALPLLEG